VLKSIDVLIGLIVVLLALSMAVTVITQAITTMLNSRGRHLRRGITDLLQQLDPGLTPALSKSIATAVLTHPLVSGSAAPLARLPGERRLGNVVHREELTKLLMGVACGSGSSQLQPAARNAMTTALTNNGVADPERTLKDIRAVALQLERSAPELSNMARQNLAILQASESDFVAKINNWFDQTMDRTSQRFTASTRAITFAGAFIVAFGLHVDTPALVNRLAADDQLRNAFVQEAQALHKAEQQRSQLQTPSPPPTSSTSDENIARRYRAFLATNGIITLPSSPGWSGFENANVSGILMTALLLSLGAPFWYSALGGLLQLRSVLAIKDDAQRTERQSSETSTARTPDAVRPSAPSASAGERGDPAAIG
jgi:hypothetical protein